MPIQIGSSLTPAEFALMRQTAVGAILLWLGSFSCSLAATYYVDEARGVDTNAGSAESPFKTTSPAIKIAQAGDTIRMVHVDFPVRESIDIINKVGEPEKPITFDGQGNLFTGSDPIDPADWMEVKPGIFRNDHLLKWLKKPSRVEGKAIPDATTAAVIQRYFFLWDGKPNHMGRCSKGIRPPLPPVDALQPGQWTYVEDEAAFYLAVIPGTKLADCQIEVPMRMNGVTIQGTCAHWVLRNLNVTHVINDGFNIHGHAKDFTYEDITATECGDDGFSQHQGPNEDSECVIRRFVSRHNATGIANLGSGTYERVVLEDNYGANLFILGGLHEFHDSVISAIAPPTGNNGILIDGTLKVGTGEPPTVRFMDCQIPQATTPNPSGKPDIYIYPPDRLGRVEILGTTKLLNPLRGIAPH